MIFVGDDSLNDLIYFERSRGVFKASDGSKGSGNNSNGKSGDDILIKSSTGYRGLRDVRLW